MGPMKDSHLRSFIHAQRTIRLGQGLGSCRTRGCLPGSDPTLNPHIAWYKKPKPVNYIHLFNIGWEGIGHWDAEAELSSLSLKGLRKP